MARKILVLDTSASMRRIIRTMILATVNDAEVDEASGAGEAISQSHRKKYHAVLFSPESSNQAWYDFIRKSLLDDTEKPKTAYVVFTSSKKQDYLDQVRPYGVAEMLEIPCAPEVLGELLTRICNPFVMRTSRRYNFPNTSSVIEQFGRSFKAEVVNFSEGGFLCDLSVPEGYDWSATSVVSLRFSIDDRMYEAGGILSTLSRLQVVESNSDYTPQRIRLAFRFVSIPPDAAETLGQVIELVEKTGYFE